MRFYCNLSAISVYKFSQFCRYVGRNIPDNCYVWASVNTNTLNTTISTPYRITMAPRRVVCLRAMLAPSSWEIHWVWTPYQDSNCSTFRLCKQHAYMTIHEVVCLIVLFANHEDWKLLFTGVFWPKERCRNLNVSDWLGTGGISMM